MRFSERHGYRSVRDVVQIESIDEALRNSLWSLLKMHVWDHVSYSSGVYGGYYLASHGNEEIRKLCERLWFSFFKKPLDKLDNDWSEVNGQLRDYFFSCEWFEVYDFIEFTANNYDRYNFRDRFTEGCNRILEREVSAYRFVGSVITRITDQEEIDEIDLALDSALGPIRAHLQRALELASDRESPDYRNSIKESISAVEGLVRSVIGQQGTLGQLIKRLEDHVHIHPALRNAFSNLYGYSSDEGGIRHALLDQEKVGFEEAKFLLVTCSAFVNYVKTRLG
jgi:hypothetical protein